MKTMLRWTSALCMLSVSTMASAGSLTAGFTVGYNEAWFENYGAWLASNPLFGETSAFSSFNNGSCSSDSGLVSTMLSGMAQGNAKVVRIFLFPALQGINFIPSASPQTQGLTPEFLGNLATVFMLAKNCNLKLYITALNANDATLSNPTLQAYYHNLFSNSVETNAYESSVLWQILGKISQLNALYPNVIYGFDLINEIEAAINAGYFSWTGARTWIQNMTTYVNKQVFSGVQVGSWLPVTSTAGWGYAVQEVTLGLFSGLGLNFYDVHIYSDSGTYSGQTALCSKTKSDKLPIVLGEYGQKSSTVNDNTQNKATTNFLNGAKSSCFSSALAWKYEAWGTSAPALSYLSITTNGALSTACTQTQLTSGYSTVPGPACARPAYTTIKNFVP